MEGFDWNVLLDNLVPILGVALVTMLAFFWGKVRGLAAASANKWDDALVKAVEDAIAKAKGDGAE